MTSFVRPPIFGIFLTYKESDHTGECNIDRPNILGGVNKYYRQKGWQPDVGGGTNLLFGQNLLKPA